MKPLCYDAAVRVPGVWLVVVALLTTAAPRLAFAGESFLAVGDDVAGWQVDEIKRQPGLTRFSFVHDDRHTAVEIGAHGAAPGPWATSRHFLRADVDPAVGEAPPSTLLNAVMDRLRAHDEAGLAPIAPLPPGGNPLPDPSATPRGPPPQVGAAPPSNASAGVGRARAGPSSAVERRWLWINLPGQMPWTLYQRYPVPSWPWWCLAFGAVWVGIRRNEMLRRWLARAEQAVERQPWPWLGVVWVGMAALRLPYLSEPFTFDALTQRLFFGSLDFSDIITHQYHDQRHPELIYLVLHVFLWFGHSELIARLPAVLFSLAAAVVIFLLARRGLGAVRALVVTVLLGLNVAFLIFSREVGDLTLFTFLVLLSTLLLLRALDTPSRRTLIAFAIVEAAMFYAYYLAILVALAHGLLLLARSRRQPQREVSAAMGAAMLLAIPSLIDLIQLVFADTGIRDVARAFPRHVWGERSIMQLWAQLAGHLTPSVEACVIITVVACIGVFRLARRPWRNPLVVVAVTIIAIAVVAVGLAVPLVRLKPYYLLFTLPLILLLTVAGCVGRSRPPSNSASGPWLVDMGAGLGVALLALIIGAYGADLRDRLSAVYHPRNPPLYRELGERIRAEPAPRIVIADPNHMHTILAYYVFADPLGFYRTCVKGKGEEGTHCHRGEEHLITLTLLPRMDEGWEQRTVERLRRHQTKPSFFVHSEHFANEPLLQEVQSRCTLEGTFGDWGKLKLFRCPARNSP